MSEAQSLLEHTKRNLVGAEQKIVQLQNALNKSESELKTLKSKVAPRSISPDVRKKMISALLHLKGQNVKIGCLLGDAEGCNYAREFREVFDAAGWTVDGISHGLHTEPLLDVQIHFGGDEPTLATIYVANLFASLGLYTDSNLYRNKDLSKGILHLYVGSKN